jgi:hypothetical protein
MFDTPLRVFFTPVFPFRISAILRNTAPITELKFHFLKVYIWNIRNCITSVIQRLARDSFEFLPGWCGIYRGASHTSLISGTVQTIQLTRYISPLLPANSRAFGLRLLQILMSRHFGMNHLLHGPSQCTLLQHMTRSRRVRCTKNRVFLIIHLVSMEVVRRQRIKYDF